MDIELLWDNLVEAGITTEDELQLVTAIAGHNIETLNAVLFYHTGYRDWEQYAESELEGEE